MVKRKWLRNISAILLPPILLFAVYFASAFFINPLTSQDVRDMMMERNVEAYVQERNILVYVAARTEFAREHEHEVLVFARNPIMSILPRFRLMYEFEYSEVTTYNRTAIAGWRIYTISIGGLPISEGVLLELASARRPLSFVEGFAAIFAITAYVVYLSGHFKRNKQGIGENDE